MFYDYTMILLIPALIFALYAQIKVKTTFNKYKDVRNEKGYTGAQVARQILDSNGLQNIGIEHISGELTDHFDPRSGVIRLSDATYASTSVAAVGVAAHETGHAMQHALSYQPMQIRSAIIPTTQFGSMLSYPLIFIGLLFRSGILIDIGIILFSFVVVFQLVTLPVEFNASNRAMRTLEDYSILSGDELKKSRKVLNAAALTYVAALITSLLNLLRLILISQRRR